MFLFGFQFLRCFGSAQITGDKTWMEQRVVSIDYIYENEPMILIGYSELKSKAIVENSYLDK